MKCTILDEFSIKNQQEKSLLSPNALLTKPGRTAMLRVRTGPCMNAGTRTPPSKTNPFLPRSLPLAGLYPDPLSDEKMIRVLSYAPIQDMAVF